MRHFARFTLSALLCFSFLLSPIPSAQPAYAAGIIVNTNADNTTTDGLCTLREAITNANNNAATYSDCTAGSGDDTITFAGNFTITLSSTLPDITDATHSLTITGNGDTSTIIQAASSAGTATYRIVKVSGSTTSATLEYMTLRYGVEASGGGINLANSASLTLNYVTLSDNQVNNSTGTGLNGGAISMNGGTLTINNSTLSNNSVTTSDTTSSVRGSGGAIFVGSGTATLNNTTISGNSAIRGGGGLFANGGTVNINYSTIANNTSNNADGSTAYSSLDGGGINRNAGTINLKSTIVAGNKKGVSSSTDNDCNGTISSQGYNLTGSGTNCSLSGTHDTTTAPSTVFTSLLGSLSDNGGQTYTHALVSGSAAVDVIPSATNGCGSTYTTDQRGGSRPYNSNCDIGAYEKRPLSVSTTGIDSGSCQITSCLTIVYAYSKASSGDTISVAAGTYIETSEIVMNPSSSRIITITGAGSGSTFWQMAASAGAASHRHFKVASSNMTLTIQNLTLRYGVEASGGAINVASGSLTLNNVTISDNQVNNSTGTGLNGGAISMNGGTLTINNSTLSNNSVTTSDTTSSVRGSGGAIFVGSGTANLNTVTVSGNSAIRGGGGLYTNGGTFNINYSTIANNTSNNADGSTAYSSLDGGGINRNAGTINLKSTIVAGNKKGVSSSTDNDCNGTTSSQGYNLTGSSTGCSISGTGDVTVSPSSVFTNVLGSLANNGGTTYTHLLYGGNAAQDAIPSGTNSCGSGSFTQDQRGSTRPYNSNCDMGAYESQDARPTVSMSTTASSLTNTSPIPVTVTFSESVTGFTSGDITAGNGTVGNFSGSGASYSFNLTPSGNGTVTADIAAGVAQDLVYNYNTAASQLSIVYDTIAPTVSMSSTTSSSTNTSPIPVTVIFSESVTGFTSGDITASNGAVSNFTGSGASYSFDLTPSANGTVTADIAASVAQDLAGNNNTAAPQFSRTYDGAAPTVNSFTAPSLSASLDIPITAFTASDNAAVTSYLITISSTPPSAGDADWAGSVPTAYTVASSGSYSLYPWVKDAAGNVSAVYSSPASVTVDTSADVVPPTVDAFTAPASSAGLDIPITAFAASDNLAVSKYFITESATPPSPADAGWTASVPTSYTVTSAGNYILYPWAKDTTGNVSAVYSSPASVSVCFSAVTVTSNADSGVGTLRQAIADACIGGTITFDNALSGDTIHLASTLDISKNLTIDGSALASKITLSGDSDSNGTGDVRVLQTTGHNSVSVALNSLIVTKGFVSGDDGGGLLNDAITTITNSIFVDNTADNGGAISTDGALTIRDSTFSGNASTASNGQIGGGAILNNYTLSITGSTFSGNTADASGGSGGAIWNAGASSITNSTFSGNSAAVAGAIMMNTGSLSITNSTISGNTTPLANFNFTGGLSVQGGTINLNNTIIANSTGKDCDISATIGTNLNNLIEDGSCSPALSGDPGLAAALANNSGRTQTLALLAGSSAIDAGDDTICAASPVSNFDQRGVTRPNSAHCDIGAYEYADASVPSVTAFTATSPASLNIPITAFTASDDATVAAYLITETPTPPSASAAGWTASAPTTYTVGSAGSYTLYPWAKDAVGNVSAVYGAPVSVIVETTAPSIVSSVPANTSPTNATSVDFIVTFSEPVSGVDASDFSLATSGIMGASITRVSGSGTTRAVSVNTGSGSGTLRLDVLDDDSIADSASNPLGGSGLANGSFSAGQLYTIDKTAPTVSSLVAPTITLSGGAIYTFTIAFNDNLAIDSASLGAGDIRVSGPGGYNQLATLVGMTTAGNGTSRIAIYQITAPGGSWESMDDGTYTVALEADQVFDSAGNSVGAGSLGSFVVRLNYTVYLPLVQR